MLVTEKKRMLLYTAIGVFSSLLFTLLLPRESWLLKITDGLFLGGMLVVAIGGFQLVYRMGMFDLFVYSHRKLRKYSGKNKDSDQAPYTESYWEYRANKPRSNAYQMPLWIGILHIFASILLIIVQNP